MGQRRSNRTPLLILEWKRFARRSSSSTLKPALAGSNRAAISRYFASTGMVVSTPAGVARRPSALICAPAGVSNSTVPRLPATDG
jgi:hypothetical protein